MRRGGGRKDSADRLMQPQAAGMSCYSVAEEITWGFEPLTSAVQAPARSTGSRLPFLAWCFSV
jgi:hypothetical protein